MNERPDENDPSHAAADGDVEALRRARAGEAAAGRSLMTRHGPSMVRTAWRVLGRYGGADAEDVVQEAFLAALTTPTLPHGDVGAWLRAISARKALDFLRRTTRRAEQPLDETREPELGPQAESPVGETALLVRQTLARLSAMDRAVLVLVDLEGRSMAETAEALGSTRVAVKLRASRARRKLARLMREEREERDDGA